VPIFVHLAPQSKLGRIRNGGIRSTRHLSRPRGVYAVPVTRNFYVSHQWLRELRRSGVGTVAGVYFRVSDDEAVWIGHYGSAHRQCTAAEAATVFHDDASVEGWEVIIPRAIDRREIQRVKALPQIVGWRYFPGAHGRRPCACPFCTKGLFGARRLRTRFSAD
jgi:hypothetical protein